MENKRIAIRLTDSPESIICAAPTLQALKIKYPDKKIGLLSRENLAEVASLIPNLDFFQIENTEESFDSIFDLDAISAEESYSEDPNWKAFLLAMKDIGPGNPYHRIDLFKKVVAADTTDTNFELMPSNDRAEKEAIEALSIGESALKIGLCVNSLPPGAVKEMVAAIEELPFPCVVYLLGTIKDRRVSASIAQDSMKMTIDLCGRLATAGQAHMLKSCDLTLCGPGLSSLLSSGYGTFTLCYDSHPEQGPNFYPYGHGHLIFQPLSGTDPSEGILKNIICETIQHTVRGNGGNIPSLEQWQSFMDSRLTQYLGKIRVMGVQRVETLLSEKEHFTELQMRPLLFMGAEYFEALHSFYRLLWEHSLNQRTLTTNDLDILHKDTIPALCQLLKPFEQVYELANFGRKYSKYIADSLNKGDMARAKLESERLQEVESLLHRLGSSFSAIKPLCAYHEKRQAILSDDNPTILAQEMSELFSSLQARVLVILDLANTLFHTTFRREAAIGSPLDEEINSNG